MQLVCFVSHLVDPDLTAHQLLAIQVGDSVLGISLCHGHEAKATGPAIIKTIG